MLSDLVKKYQVKVFIIKIYLYFCNPFFIN